MSFKRETTKDYFLLDTSIENMFINEYMPTAPGEYVKVYLFALMYADLGGDLTNEEIAKHLSMEQEDVLKAWTYWEKMGVIRKRYIDPADRLHYNVEFVMLKEQLYGDKSNVKATEAAIDPGINAIMADKEIQTMFAEIEKLLGRVINSSEMRSIISWINDYHATPEIVVYGFNYCLQKKKNNIKYIGTVVCSWAADGYRTLEALEEHLSELDKQQHNYRRVFQALGFSRNATEEERRIMDRWFDDMHFSLEEVLEACSKTAGISSPNINYVNKVLANWYEEAGGKKNIAGRDVSVGDIMSYYEEVRRQEEEAAETRQEEVFRKIPRIREIENEIGSASAEIAKVVISDVMDKKAATDALRKKIDDLNMEKAFLLTDNGYELDYMDVKYRCPHCKDTGVLETGERCQCFGEVTKEKIAQTMANR